MLSTITNPTNNWISRSIVGITTKSSVKLSSRPTTRPIGKRCVEFFLFLGGGWAGGKVRKIFLYQKNILFASKKTHFVGTIEKRAFLSPERRSIESPFC
ncbi:hypothetical protein [Leptospira interrogans]|uniref:hypothetical protein n=1 Tax=Leptospira interrogans TaxID=173 RepID=UPI000AC9F495|nr:hypothetical protein [Leptospira interrogans]